MTWHFTAEGTQAGVLRKLAEANGFGAASSEERQRFLDTRQTLVDLVTQHDAYLSPGMSWVYTCMASGHALNVDAISFSARPIATE